MNFLIFKEYAELLISPTRNDTKFVFNLHQIISVCTFRVFRCSLTQKQTITNDTKWYNCVNSYRNTSKIRINLHRVTAICKSLQMLSNPKADNWYEMIQTCQFVSDHVRNSHQFASGHFSLDDKSHQTPVAL